MTFKVNILWLVSGFKEKWLRTEKGRLDCPKRSYIVWFLWFFGHSVLLYCLKPVRVRKKWRPRWDLSIEALHMILCVVKKWHNYKQKRLFFQFWGHNHVFSIIVYFIYREWLICSFENKHRMESVCLKSLVNFLNTRKHLYYKCSHSIWRDICIKLDITIDHFELYM